MSFSAFPVAPRRLHACAALVSSKLKIGAFGVMRARILCATQSHAKAERSAKASDTLFGENGDRDEQTSLNLP